MKKGLTELVFIVDRSGSMAGLESDTIGGFNATLEAHRKEEGDAYVSTVLFDDRTEVLHDRIPIEKVGPLTTEEYWVRGCTALLDTVGGSIRHISRVHGYLPEEWRPERTIFVITTDGLENASHTYTYDKVKSMISQKKEEGWDFLFLGANIDAVEEAGRIGIAPNRAATYLADSEGTAVMHDAVCAQTVAMRNGSAGDTAQWKAPIARDVAKRGGVRHGLFGRH